MISLGRLHFSRARHGVTALGFALNAEPSRDIRPLARATLAGLEADARP
jgi:hypothetical protein